MSAKDASNFSIDKLYRTEDENKANDIRFSKKLSYDLGEMQEDGIFLCVSSKAVCEKSLRFGSARHC